ncbi:uncharacterized protein LODBEIA_P01730 [Lodderomyces beijingensis]|uniref:Transcriptional regulatory protein RXT2 N-terminal domain-containing protein n=1 Tax=Lodderomyces beijingensis TaxID=1775926 RepID=A0ABP0ZCP3_9ASCO
MSEDGSKCDLEPRDSPGRLGEGELGQWESRANGQDSVENQGEEPLSNVSPAANLEEGEEEEKDVTANGISSGRNEEVDGSNEQRDLCENELEAQETSVHKDKLQQSDAITEPQQELDIEESTLHEENDNGNDDNDKDNDIDDDYDDDEFGDFDEFDEYESRPPPPPPPESPESSTIAIPESAFNNRSEFQARLEQLMSKLFILPATFKTDTTADPSSTRDTTVTTTSSITAADSLLDNERVRTIYKQISTLPYLQPPNWIKSDIRHNLLIKLNIPVNLDELKTPPAPASAPQQTSSSALPAHHPGLDRTSSGSGIPPPHPRIAQSGNRLTVPRTHSHTRKKSISVEDIDWSDFPLPDLDDLKMNKEEISRLIESTTAKISQFEIDNMENSTVSYLQSRDLDVIDAKLDQLKSNHEELLVLSTVWLNQLSELRKDYEIYENVVQSCIGYSQKLRREEILENLKKTQSSKSIKFPWKKKK